MPYNVNSNKVDSKNERSHKATVDYEIFEIFDTYKERETFV